MVDNGVLLKQFERVCRCKHEWKFQIEKDGYKKYWCPKCNGVKKEISDEDDIYNKDTFLSELEDSLREMNEMRKKRTEVN